ncbi:MAG TPA: hypothetical protein VGI73_16995 [Solirubrobacterales bacterium]|jgi:hypothetical protein
MHDQAISPGERDDLRTQAAVIALILAEHPTLLTLDDVLIEIGGGDDAVPRAVRDLTAVGLLRQDGGSVLATRAALAFDRLPL